MIKTLNKHVRWRKDKEQILICDCKRLIDLKMPFEFEKVIKKIAGGINKNELNNKEKLLFSDFEKLKMICNLEIRQIKKSEFQKAMEILSNELKDRVRNNNFLLQKFKKFPQFFIGVFLDNELIGVICGFPREDYLLLSELAIDSKFQEKGFGKKLVKYFEEIAKKDYNKINVGAQDNAINFYLSLSYKSFLLIQYKKGDYSLKDFKKMNLIKDYEKKNQITIEVKINKINLDYLKKLKKKYPKANFQYIFTKKIIS